MTGPNTSPEVCAQVGQLLLDPKRPLKERWVSHCGNTINNIPGTKTLTKAYECESCGRDVTNKLSLKFHIAIEKSDYETMEKVSSEKRGEKDCSFQAKFSIEETIRHFGTTHLEVTSQIEMDNAELDSPHEKDGEREDDGNDTNHSNLENRGFAP